MEHSNLTGAYARGLYHALGVDDLDRLFDAPFVTTSRPLVGVASSASELVPGHAHLDQLAEAVKQGVRSEFVN